MTRIIAGGARGRRLAAPRGADPPDERQGPRRGVQRPRPVLRGGDVLDLYAGTGALALEALSRGCARAVCVEADRGAAEVIARNAAACGLEGRVEVRRGRVEDVVQRLPRGAFVLAFVDPPYAEGPETALALAEGCLAPGARAVAEHDARRATPERVGGLALADRRTYGGTGISIYVRE